MKEIDIDQILKELQTDVHDAVEKVSKDMAKEGVQKLKANSPRRTGAYASGWGQSKQGNEIVLHNKKRPSLTHLLEKGHASRNGGRVSPQKHIEPVEEMIKKEMVNRIEKALK